MIPRRLAHLRPSGAPSAELVQYPNVFPVFIIGSVRSGTSAMMAALREGAQIPGFNEGVLAHLLPALLAVVREHYSSQQQKPMTMLGSVPEEFWTTSIKNMFGKAFVDTMGEGRWLDKTPGGASIVAACPVLLEIFPNAKFIFCKRRGIENVLSRQTKFAGRDFEAHCQGWAATMQAWLEVAPQLGGNAIVVDQREMALEHELVGQKLADLLELSAKERESVTTLLRERRLEQTRPTQDDVPVKLAQTGWTEEQQETFKQICGPMMSAFGYDIDAEGARDKKSVYQFFVPVADGTAQRENIPDRRACRALDATRFKITPNSYGSAPAGIRHRMLDMNGFRRFSVRVRAIGAGTLRSEGLVFCFALERSEDRARVFSAEQVVKAGPESEWVCDLPPLSGLFDAVLSVRPVANEQIKAPRSALWADARLT